MPRKSNFRVMISSVEVGTVSAHQRALEHLGQGEGLGNR